MSIFQWNPIFFGNMQSSTKKHVVLNKYHLFQAQWEWRKRKCHWIPQGFSNHISILWIWLSGIYMCMYQILSLSMNIQYKKNAKVSELVRFLIYWDKSVMQLYFLIPSKERKKVTLRFPFSRQNPVYSFNQLLSCSGGKEEGRDQSRKVAFQSTKKMEASMPI